ncbi:MAG: hypothetical protein LUC97_00570 [Clostridiales bacterium]|nr:hypothetical protein [Clostridiales bacterium]
MIKENFNVYAEDDLYLIKPISDEDRDNYMKTLIVNSGIPKIYDVPGYSDIV